MISGGFLIDHVKLKMHINCFHDLLFLGLDLGGQFTPLLLQTRRSWIFQETKLVFPQTKVAWASPWGLRFWSV